MEIHAAPAAHPVDADGAAAGAANDQDVKGPAPSPPPPNDNANGDDAAAGGAEIAEQARGEKEAVPPEAGHPQATSAAPEAEPAAPAPGPDTEPAQPASNAADAEGASDAADPPQPASGAAGAEAPAAAGADAGAGDVGDEQVVSRLREQLATVDLTTTTEKQLRKKLEADFGVDLSHKKKLLRAEIERYLTEHAGPEEEEQEATEAAEEEGEEEEEEERMPSGSRKRSRGGGLGGKLSEAMQAFLGERTMSRTQVVKRLWEYIKANNLQDPSNKRRIKLDDKLSTIFPGKSVDMFSMNKHLSKHCFTSDVLGGSESERSGSEEEEEEEEKEAHRPKRARAAASKISSGKKAGSEAKKSGGSSSSQKRSRRRKSSGEGGEEGTPRVSGFTKPCKLSPELAAFIGKDVASRPEVTKFFFKYIEDARLKDPSNKSFVNADEVLQGLTGEQRFKAFSFNGLIKQHFHGYAE